MRFAGAILVSVLAAAAASPAAHASERLSLGGYFLGADAPDKPPRALGGGVVSFTPRLGGFQLGPVEVGLGAAAGQPTEQFAIGAPAGREWSAGASLGWIGFTLSGAIEGGADERLGLNLQYDLGGWTLSMGGGRATAEDPAGGESRQLQLELGATYTFGPGVLSSFGVQTYAPGEETYVAGEGDSVYFTGGLKLRF